LKQYYSYEEFRRDTNSLLQEVKSFQPEAIVGIARGGLTLSHALAEGLNIREVQTLRTELYDVSCKREELTLFGSCDFVGKTRVLVVDDIADSGETLEVIMKHLEKSFENIEFKSATLFYKQTSKYKPHFWINEAKNWIEFFWEVDFKEK
jgi:xanthine phosphoribosyltransferase